MSLTGKVTRKEKGRKSMTFRVEGKLSPDEWEALKAKLKQLLDRYGVKFTRISKAR